MITIIQLCKTYLPFHQNKSGMFYASPQDKTVPKFLIVFQFKRIFLNYFNFRESPSNNQTYLTASRTNDNVVYGLDNSGRDFDTSGRHSGNGNSPPDFGTGRDFTSSTPRHKFRTSPDRSPISSTTQL